MKNFLFVKLLVIFNFGLAQDCFETDQKGTKITVNQYTDITQPEFSVYKKFIIKGKSSKDSDELYEFESNSMVEGFLFHEIMERKSKPKYAAKLPDEIIKYVDSLRADTSAKLEIHSKLAYLQGSKTIVIIKYRFITSKESVYGVLNIQREKNTYTLLNKPIHPKLAYILKSLRRDKLGVALRPNTGNKQLDEILKNTKTDTYKTNIDMYYDELVKIKKENKSLYDLICDN